MTPEELKHFFGDEYPYAVISKGIRQPLVRERRFSRYYHSQKHNTGTQISRFMDGTASITAPEFQQAWPRWTQSERTDFCQNCAWLHKQSDFPDMLRFIIEHGGPRYWSAIAGRIAGTLPRDEAFETLVRALQITEIGHSSNITQGIASTKHPQAEGTLRRHMETIWNHPKLWENAKFTNWVAYDATTCITHLLELGAPPPDFEPQVIRLSKHPCVGNRDSCRNFLAKYYPFLA